MEESSSTTQAKSDRLTETEDHSQRDGPVQQLFKKQWPVVTDANKLALFGFRRFRTSHLLNLRLIEEEIKVLDHRVYQAGLTLEDGSRKKDRLALSHAKLDQSSHASSAMIDCETTVRLRSLIKEYDEALIAFNQVMTMETFALADHQWLSSRDSELSGEETYRTRLVRIDRVIRSQQRDVLQHFLRKLFRAAWFRSTDRRRARHTLPTDFKDAYQNTALIADAFARFIFGLAAGALLIVPMVLLSRQSSNDVQLLTVSLCIIVFSFLVALASQATPQETMAATAAYAAVLVVFVSNRIV